MATSFQHGEIRAALKQHGMTNADLAWLDAIGWSDAAVAPIASEQEAKDYARREAALNGSIAQLLAADRMGRVESKLAAAIGARVADWRERDEED